MASVTVRTRAGYAAVETIVALTLLGLVLAGVCEILRTQGRFYRTHVRRLEAWDAAHAAREILAAELRGVSPAAGDLYAFALDSVALRALVGFAVVCGVDGAGTSWWLRGAAGSFETRPRDSVLVFVEGDATTGADDRWATARFAEVERAMGAACADGGAAQLRARPERPLPGVTAGAPLHAFRPYVYRLYPDGSGRWWLGRRLRGAAIQPVAGPMRPPAEDGLAFRGFDARGDPATDAAGVASVRVELRAAVPAGGSAVEAGHTFVFLRNARYGRSEP